MKMGNKIRKAVLLLAIIFLTSCGKDTLLSNQNQNDGRQKIVLGIFEENPDIAKQVTQFNEKNNEYYIEIVKYERSSISEEDGIAKLQREIMEGKGPDIIDFGLGYSISDIVGKYTEDLSSYLEDVKAQNQNGYFWNIMQAFNYDNGLYAMPVSFSLHTFAGSTDVIGNQTTWTIQEMIDCYEKQKGNKILYPGETKRVVFGTILTGSLDYYIDWEKCSCNFQGEEFQKLMKFANQFPESLRISDDYSVKQTFMKGEALLLPLRLLSIYDICQAEYIFDEDDINYVGFPVEGGCGTVIQPSDTMLAISVNSKYKEVAWGFLNQFLSKEYQSKIESGLPLSRRALEEKLLANREVEYTKDSEGNQIRIAKEKVLFEGDEPIEIYNITEKQANRLLTLIENATNSTTVDYSLYNILLEEAEGYFYGDKTLAETVDIMQSRASIYVSEKVK